MIRRLTILLLIVGCEGILSPEFLLEGEWEQFLQKTTNIETGEVDIIETKCGGVFRMFSDGRLIIGNRNIGNGFGVTDSTCDTIYYSGQASWSWSADVNKIYFHREDDTIVPATTDGADYSIHGDTLIWEWEDGRGNYHQNSHKRLKPDQLRVYWDMF